MSTVPPDVRIVNSCLAAVSRQYSYASSRSLNAVEDFKKRAYRAMHSRMGSLTQIRFVASLFLVLPALLLCGALPVWGTQTLTFNGVTSVLSTGSNTLSGPFGIATDTSLNVYIADTGNNRIVKVAQNGASSVLAINGLTSPSTLSSPKGLAIDGSGVLYIADTGNSRIVKVNSAGDASVLSTGPVILNAPQGLAIDAAGNIFISDTGNNQIVKIPATGTPFVYSIAILTPLNSPRGLAEDVSGNLYIADAANSRIVKVVPSGPGTGTGTPLPITGVTPTTPASVAVDSYGTLYIADANPASRRIISVTTAMAGADFSSAHGLTSYSSEGVAVDIFGNVYLADGVNSKVAWVQTRSIGFGHNTLGSSPARDYPLVIGGTAGPNLTNLTIPTLGRTGLDFTSSGSTSCSAGTYNGSTCIIGVGYSPANPGFRQGGMILTYIDNSVVPQVTRSLTVPLYAFNDAPQAALYPGIVSVLNSGSVATQRPYQIAVDGSGTVYVGNTTGNNVVRIPTSGSATVLNTGSFTLGAVKGVVVDGAGNRFIADSSNNQIYEVTAVNRTYQLSIEIAGTPVSLNGPTALAVNGAGDLFIADNGNNRILKVALQDPTLATTFPLTGIVVNTGSYTFSGNTITGLAVDSQNNLYIVDSNASQVVKVTAAGVASIMAFPGLTLSKPEGVAVDGMGNIYVSDAGNNRIVQLTTAGIATVVPIQGLANPPILGGGSGAEQDIFGLTVDSSGNIYVADTANNRVVKVNVSQASLSFASTRQYTTSSDSPQTAIVTNLGNQPLVFSANPTYTPNFVENSGDTNLCTSTTSLSPGTACDVSVKFTPQSVGSLSALIALKNNALNASSSTQLVAVSGTGLIPGDTTATTQTNPALASYSYGEPITISVHVADTTHTSSIPTGNVVFADALTSTITPKSVDANGNATLLDHGVLGGIGAHSIVATYEGVEGSFLTSSTTISITITRASVTATGPATAPIVSVGQSSSATITLTPQYSGTGVIMPSGTISYSVLNSSNATVLSGTAALAAGGSASTASVPIPNTLAAGSYTINVNYGGDTNYQSRTASPISLTVQQITPAINWNTSGGITYGTSLNGLLTATASSSGNSVAGTFTYTATPSSGSATVVTASTVLAAGMYTLQATFSPTNSETYATATSSIALTVSKATPTLSWTPSATSIAYGTTLSGILNATASSNSNSVAGTFTYTATPSGGSASAVTNPTVLAAGSYTLSVTFTPTDSTNYATATSTASLTVSKATPTVSWIPSAASIAYGTTLSGILNATASFNSSNVAGMFTYTATPSGGSASVVTNASVLAVGNYTLSVTFVPSDSADYTSATGSVALSIGKTAPAVSLVTSANPTIVTGAITFTATVTSSGSAPTGTIGFYDGTTLLGTVALSSARAAYTTSSLTAGTHTITASYAGDSNFLSATSAALSQIVTDFTVTGGTGTTGGSSGGSGSTGVPTQTVQPGGTATYNVQVAPSLGTIAPADVILTVTHNLPAGSSAVLSASGVSTSGSTLVLPGGQAMPAVQLTVHLPSPTAVLHRSTPLSAMPFAFGFMLLPFGGKLGREAGRRVRRSGLGLVLLLVGLAAILGLAGCGAVNTGFSAQRDYTITVTATSGTLSHSTNFNLTVQ